MDEDEEEAVSKSEILGPAYIEYFQKKKKKSFNPSNTQSSKEAVFILSFFFCHF